MNFFNRWRHDPADLERAVQAEKRADRALERSKENAAWARRTLETNHLTERFYASLRGGHS